MGETVWKLIKKRIQKRIKNLVPKSRKATLESFEPRNLMAGLPYGAADLDTGEYMLGRVAVTPVLLESQGTKSTEDWNPEHIQTVLSNLNAGLAFWDDLLATKSTVHSLEFVVDDTYATNPVPTDYEPINGQSNDYVKWVSEFLILQGFNQSTDLELNIKAFNNAQRIKFNTDWAFTVFVVNSQREGDGTFAPGGNFSRAFAFAGGLFFVTPSTRPASTYAHETGHMFWARDEYAGGGSYNFRRGYYNTQNLNAIDDNPIPNFQQATSIMSAGNVLQTAFDTRVSPASTLAMIGWQDTDLDGIFDVLDVPLKLDGSGRLDATAGLYRFKGRAKVGTLMNLNSSGPQNDITLNRVSRIEARINGGAWTTIATPDAYEVDLDLAVPIAGATNGTIEIRAVNASTNITSNLFTGNLSAGADATAVEGINGFVWSDKDSNGVFAPTESVNSQWTVKLVDGNGSLLNLQKTAEPDDMPEGPIDGDAYPGVALSTIGEDTDGQLGVVTDPLSSTGSKVFQPNSVLSSGFLAAWTGDMQMLRVDFPINANTNFVSVDVIGFSDESYGRLEVYSSQGKLLGRSTTALLAPGEVQTLSIGRGSVSDIKYAIIKGHMKTSIMIDNLRFGPSAQTKTDTAGRYSFENLPAGNYNVQAVPPSSGYQFTNPSTGTRSVTVTDGQAQSHIDFGVHFTGSPWHNETLYVDVNASNSVTPLDALLVINLLNARGSLALTGSGIPNQPYVDVNNDGNLTPLDALQVINYLNLNGLGGEGENSLGGKGSSGRAGSGSNGSSGSNGQGGIGEGEVATVNRITPVYERYTDTVGPAITDNKFMERLESPRWTTPIPCHCAYCLGLGEED